jgi:hypothetical protein
VNIPSIGSTDCHHRWKSTRQRHLFVEGFVPLAAPRPATHDWVRARLRGVIPLPFANDPTRHSAHWCRSCTGCGLPKVHYVAGLRAVHHRGVVVQSGVKHPFWACRFCLAHKATVRTESECDGILEPKPIGKEHRHRRGFCMNLLRWLR